MMLCTWVQEIYGCDNIQILPITTQTKRRRNQVQFMRGHLPLQILCKGIKSISKDQLKSGNYCCTIDDETMQKVDYVLLSTLGLLDYTRKKVRMAVEHYNMVENPTEDSNSFESTDELETIQKEKIVTEFETTDTSIIGVHTKKESEKRQRNHIKGKQIRHSWNEDLALEFIVDSESLSTEEILKKYGLTSRSSLYSTKSRLKKLYNL